MIVFFISHHKAPFEHTFFTNFGSIHLRDLREDVWTDMQANTLHHLVGSAKSTNSQVNMRYSWLMTLYISQPDFYKNENTTQTNNTS